MHGAQQVSNIGLAAAQTQVKTTFLEPCQASPAFSPAIQWNATPHACSLVCGKVPRSQSHLSQVDNRCQAEATLLVKEPHKVKPPSMDGTRALKVNMSRLPVFHFPWLVLSCLVEDKIAFWHLMLFRRQTWLSRCKREFLIQTLWGSQIQYSQVEKAVQHTVWKVMNSLLSWVTKMNRP